MSSPTYQLPSLFKSVLGRLPVYPGSVLFTRTLNLVVTKRLPADTLAALEGHALRIDVRDAGIRFDFTCRRGAFVAARHADDVALTISASAHDFFLLAQRKEDPDTLFFNRRLTMEGDTELGLLVKNSLDAIDLGALNLERFLPARLLARVGAPKRRDA